MIFWFLVGMHHGNESRVRLRFPSQAADVSSSNE